MASVQYTPELLERFDKALAECATIGQEADPAEIFARHEIGLVELSRATFLIDQRVYQSALERGHAWRRLAERWTVQRHPTPDTWRSLTP